MSERPDIVARLRRARSAVAGHAPGPATGRRPRWGGGLATLLLAAASVVATPSTAPAQRVEASVLGGALAYRPVLETDLATEGGGGAWTIGVRLGRGWFVGSDVTATRYQVSEGEPFYTNRTSAVVVLAEAGRRAALGRRLMLSASAGAGVVRTSSRLMSQTFVARDPALHAGGGLDVSVTRRIALAADVRYLRSFGFPNDASRIDIDPTRLPWPGAHHVRAGIGARVRW